MTDGAPVYFYKSLTVNTQQNWDYFPTDWKPLELVPRVVLSDSIAF
jgi:hypothetical protein